MRAITLTQPWATLVAIGAKQIETRSWATSYRGPLAIHAAKGLGPVGGLTGLAALCQREPFAKALNEAGFTLGIVERQRAHVIAVVELVDCQPTDSLAPWRPSVRQDEFAFGDYSPGRFMWRLANVRGIPMPIPAKGALGLWEWPYQVADGFLVPTARAGGERGG
jgi:hypothetical protein